MTRALDLDGLDIAVGRLLPITTHDTPDYAEVSFGDVRSQTMTMEPEIFLLLNALPDLIAAARERDGLRAENEMLRKALEPFAAFIKFERELQARNPNHPLTPDTTTFVQWAGAFGAPNIKATFGDLRRARHALTNKADGEER